MACILIADTAIKVAAAKASINCTCIYSTIIIFTQDIIFKQAGNIDHRPQMFSASVRGNFSDLNYKKRGNPPLPLNKD